MSKIIKNLITKPTYFVNENRWQVNIWVGGGITNFSKKICDLSCRRLILTSASICNMIGWSTYR